MILRYPLILALIPPILWLLYLSLKKQNATKVLHFPIAHRELSFSSNLQIPVWLPFTLRCTAFALALFALARPQSSSSMSHRLSEGIDIMISFDVV